MKWTWDIDPILIHFTRTFGIRYYGLIFSLVFIGGFFLFRWQILRAGGSEDDAYDILLPGVVGTIVGARLGHVFFYQWDRVISDPLWLLEIWKGGLASHGALLGLILAILYYARRHRQSYLECLDRFSFSAALGATMIRIGNFLNSEIVGRVTGQDWGVRFPRFDGLPGKMSPLRHPSQLYEACLGMIVIAVLYFVDRKAGREHRPRGLLAGTFLAVYFTGRFLVEFFKEYHTLPTSSPLTMGQFLSLPAIAAGLILIRLSLTRGVSATWNLPQPAPEAKSARGGKSRKGGSKSSKKKKR